MRNGLEPPERRRRRGGSRLAWVVGLALVAAAAVVALRVGPPPEITIEPGLPGIGRRTPIRVSFEEPSRGLGRLQVELVQGERTTTLAERRHRPLAPWQLGGPRTARDEVLVEAGSETVEGLVGGEAVVRASAWPAPSWLRHPAPRVVELTLPVRLVPPDLELRSQVHNVAQGGCGVVVYRTGPSAARHGVEAGDRFFPGFPLPGGQDGDHFALFGVPWDVDDRQAIRLLAEDEVENRTHRDFVDRLLPRPPSDDRIELADAFLERVVPAIRAATPELEDRGGLLENYLQINGELRRSNDRTLIELAAGSRPEFLWRQPFLALPRGQVMSAFADRRTYFYAGREVDRQVHLGFDLASVRRAPVPAANRGVVALARYLGIYGNAVVLDHGYGLMSLYGHLSAIEVAPGDVVERGQSLGRTGETGLAGGDHLHFTLLLHGLPVDPVEWWDPRWIRDRIAAKLGPALPFSP